MKRKNGYFTASLYVDGRRKFFYSRISKADAERKKEEYKIKNAAREMLGFKERERVLFSVWAAQWLLLKEQKVRATTFETTYRRPVENHIIPAFRGRYLHDIRPLDIDAFLLKKQNLAQSTLQKMMICLRSIFDSAVDNDLIDKNPAKNVRAKSKAEKIQKKTYSAEQVDEIIKFCETDKDGVPIRILLECGLRDGELCGLKWEDINLTSKTVTVKRSVADVRGGAEFCAPKTESSKRTIPISSAFAEYLSARKGKGLILQSTSDKPKSPKNFCQQKYRRFFDRFIEYRKESGARGEFPRLSPHELRHTCGTLLYARSKNIYAVSKFLGHSSVEVTAKIYVHDDEDILRSSLLIE